jgi:hypothetical protein
VKSLRTKAKNSSVVVGTVNHQVVSKNHTNEDQDLALTLRRNLGKKLIGIRGKKEIHPSTLYQETLKDMAAIKNLHGSMIATTIVVAIEVEATGDVAHLEDLTMCHHTRDTKE